MPVQHRPPMRKLPPFALEGARVSRGRRSYYEILFFGLFALPLLALHVHLLALPFFWDEHGQFIPTALDLLRTGSWVAHSTLPNVHPPGVEAYLVLWYKLFGYSITGTRIAMLLIAGAGLLFTFLLAIELSQGTEGAPAFLPPLFLLASPLFYTQSMMAQLDMPAMVLTLLALLFFLKNRFLSAGVACVALVLVKETGIVVPAVFAVACLLQKEWRRALLFVPSGLALVGWLLFLRANTGFWLGNPEFAHYNVGYALHPTRIVFSFVRRIYYLFFAEFRWIGTLAIVWAARRLNIFRARSWRIALAVSVALLILVSVLGGAALERYLLPVLPIFYIAASVSLTLFSRRVSVAASAALLVGLAANLFWNPPYPFPYENNYAMVDFVHLQQVAARFAEHSLPQKRIATAWPYSAALQRADYGFVERPLQTVETQDFHVSSIRALPQDSYDALITYTRTWSPETGFLSIPLIRTFLSRFYEWEPDITSIQCAELGLAQVASWESRGQEISIYVRPGTHRAAQRAIRF